MATAPNFFSLTAAQQQAYLNGDPNYQSATGTTDYNMTGGSSAPSMTAPAPTSVPSYTYNPSLPPGANNPPPTGLQAQPFGSGTSVVPDLSTYLQQFLAQQNSPMQGNYASADIASAAGDPLFGQSVNINGQQVPWNSMTQEQQAMYSYANSHGIPLPSNFMSTYQGSSNPNNQSYQQLGLTPQNNLPGNVTPYGTLSGPGQQLLAQLAPGAVPNTMPTNAAGLTPNNVPGGGTPTGGIPGTTTPNNGGMGYGVAPVGGSGGAPTMPNPYTGGFSPNPFTSPTGGSTNLGNPFGNFGSGGNFGSTTFSAPTVGSLSAPPITPTGVPGNVGTTASQPTSPATPGSTVDQALASASSTYFNPLLQTAAGAGPGAPVNSPLLSSLQGMAGGTGAGASIDTTNQWANMVAAMQRPMQEQQANLAEAMNVSGGRFSSGFGTAMTDLTTQQGLQEQALLSQLQVPAMEQAQQIQAGAGTTLGSLGQQSSLAAQGLQAGASGQLAGVGEQALSQLSSQNFQSQMQQYAASLAAAQQMAGLSGGAAQQLAGQGATGANNLLQGSITGAQGLFGAENTAGLNSANQVMQLLGLGNQFASGMDQSWIQNLLAGSQMGGQQWGLQQSQLSNAYQNWMSGQPWANPMLQYLMGAATGVPSLNYPQYQPGALGQIVSGMASAAGTGAGLAMASDIRIKDVREFYETELGKELGLDAYRFSYLWEPKVERVGFMAQDVEKKYPWAVKEVLGGLKTVDYGKLAEAAVLLHGVAA